MEVESVVPILRIFDVAKAKEFYLGFLGMSVDWEHTFEPGMPVYMQVSRGDKLVLHLTEHHGDCCPGSTVYIRFRRGLEEFHREISSKGYKFARPGIEVEEWGQKSVEVSDPFGNKLRFCEKIEATEGLPAADVEAVVEK